MGSIYIFKLLAVYLSKQLAVDKPGDVKLFPREILRKIFGNTVIQTWGCRL